MDKKVKKSESIRKRKNFLPTIILTVFLWLIVFLIIWYLDPFAIGAIPAFLFFVFLASLFLLSLLFANTRRGFFLSLGLVVFLLLRYFGIGNVINFILLAGILLVIEVYFTKV